MTPLFEKLRIIFQELVAKNENMILDPKTGEKLSFREAAEREMNICQCDSCTAISRALGDLPIETVKQEQAVMSFLMEFVEHAAPPQFAVQVQLHMMLEAANPAYEKVYGTPEERAEMTKKHNEKKMLEEVQQKLLGVLEQRKEQQLGSEQSEDASMGNEAKQQPAGTMSVEAVMGAMVQAMTDKDIFKNTQIVREGEKIILPKGMSCRQGIQALERQAKEEETKVAISIDIDAYPLEGARAFHSAISEKFGWVDRVPTPGFWSDTPPQMIGIEVDVGKTEQIMWGRIVVPAIDGFLMTGFTVKDSRFLFCIEGEVKQKHKYLVEEIAELTRQHLKAHSMYKGKALKITFPDPTDEANFNPLNSPKFVDTSLTKSNELIFSKEIHEQIETALFNPIECTERCRELGISLKRGTLLAGTYGVGKSMAAAVTAKKCVENNWTFLYVDHAEELPRALLFAKQYAPAVVFVEDVDKVLKGERNSSLDQILNTIDGIDTKNSDVMLVFTTNNLKVINKAALRAKRLDFVIEIQPPDAEAVGRLIRQYTRGNIAPKETLVLIGEMLAGQIPANIEEVCSRAQLAAVRRIGKGEKLQLKESDLLIAGRTMLKQLELTNVEVPTSYGNSVEKGLDKLGQHLRLAVNDAFAAKTGEKIEKTPNGKKAQLRNDAS